ncbi:hypothetical protein [Psychrobacillus mangrovi]|uniref:hypothetical protein n=1 Tax=Psychrobacillus mangrovi TaxID=3117745 RepID=UPI0039B746BB
MYVIIRNAFSQVLTIENLPIQLFDATGDLLCKLGFHLVYLKFLLNRQDQLVHPSPKKFS